MSQTNFSYEDFILTQVHKALKKSSFISSSWERLAEKSSSWKCYVYNNAQEFICVINMTFNPNFDKNKLIPIGLDVVIDSAEKKVNDDNDWDEVVPDWELGMDESNSESNSENNGENNSQVNNAEADEEVSIFSLFSSNLGDKNKSSKYSKLVPAETAFLLVL